MQTITQLIKDVVCEYKNGSIKANTLERLFDDRPKDATLPEIAGPSGLDIQWGYDPYGTQATADAGNYTMIFYITQTDGTWAVSGVAFQPK